MKAITLWQPWASLLVVGLKRFETRSWRTSHRGPIAVHAAKIRNETPEDVAAIAREAFGEDWGELPRGAIVGQVRLTDTARIVSVTPLMPTAIAARRERALGDWTPGRHAWRTEDHRILQRPVPFKGRQGMFEVADELLAPSVPISPILDGDGELRGFSTVVTGTSVRDWLLEGVQG